MSGKGSVVYYSKAFSALPDRCMLILHQYAISPFCDKARRILHWKCVPCRISEFPLAQRVRVRTSAAARQLPGTLHANRGLFRWLGTRLIPRGIRSIVRDAPG